MHKDLPLQILRDMYAEYLTRDKLLSPRSGDTQNAGRVAVLRLLDAELEYHEERPKRVKAEQDALDARAPAVEALAAADAAVSEARLALAALERDHQINLHVLRDEIAKGGPQLQAQGHTALRLLHQQLTAEA